MHDVLFTGHPSESITHQPRGLLSAAPIGGIGSEPHKSMVGTERPIGGGLDEAELDWVGMDGVAMSFKILFTLNAMLPESPLPYASPSIALFEQRTLCKLCLI